MKLTDKLETLLACLPESPFKQHLREEIESTVRQDAEAVVRELVRALETCTPGDYSTGHVIHQSFDENAVEKALARAQQWLDLSSPDKTD